MQLVALHDSSYDQLCLHECEIFPNTLAGSSTERKEGILWRLNWALGIEAFWIELLRLFPKCRMVMRYVGTHPDSAVPWDTIATKFVIFPCFSVSGPDWRIEPQGFFEHHSSIGKMNEMLSPR